MFIAGPANSHPDLQRLPSLESLPFWIRDWVTVIAPLGEALLILGVAWVLRTFLRKVVQWICERYEMSPEMAVGARRVSGFLVYTAALLLILERMGVSRASLWTALTGFTAVAAIAFFAAWSVLSNVFCTLLILVIRPFRLHDHIELIENGEKPGMQGRVIDVNFIYTTLQETRADGEDITLQIPNSQFFQRTIRRWRGTSSS